MSAVAVLSWVEEVPAMGVVDDLARARETFERGDWAAAYDVWSDAPPTTPDDLRRLATAALLAGRHGESVAALQEDALGIPEGVGALLRWKDGTTPSNSIGSMSGDARRE